METSIQGIVEKNLTFMDEMKVAIKRDLEEEEKKTTKCLEENMALNTKISIIEKENLSKKQ